MTNDESIVSIQAALGETSKYIKRRQLKEARRSLQTLITEANSLYDVLTQDYNHIIFSQFTEKDGE